MLRSTDQDFHNWLYNWLLDNKQQNWGPSGPSVRDGLGGIEGRRLVASVRSAYIEQYLEELNVGGEEKLEGVLQVR